MSWRGCSSCGSLTCRVDYWRDVVARGYRNAAGVQVALDGKDAQLALGSAELLCKYVAVKPSSPQIAVSITVPFAIVGMSSWLVEDGSVCRLGKKRRSVGRAKQRAKIRERIAATGQTSTRSSR